MLALVQAEILLALKPLPELLDRPGIHELALESRVSLAQEWIDHFCDPNRGTCFNV